MPVDKVNELGRLYKDRMISRYTWNDKIRQDRKGSEVRETTNLGRSTKRGVERGHHSGDQEA